MHRFKPDRLYCFSPAVMLVTIIVEVSLLIKTLYFYRRNTAVRLIAAILFFLALFQLAEYNVCEGAFGVNSLTWSRIGYAAITTLPALGLHLIFAIGGRKPGRVVVGAYLAMASFMLYYLFVDFGLTSSVCMGNYVIFEVSPHLNNVYALYYYGLELAAAIFAWRLSKTIKSQSAKESLVAMVVAYLALMIPTTTVNLVNPETIRGIPSIMCGFAVIFAIILGTYVLPRVSQPHKKQPRA